MREFRVNFNDAGQRLDKYLTKSLPLLPKSLMYKSIRKKKIKVNRGRAEPSQILSEGDTIQLFLAEELFETTPEDVYKRQVSDNFVLRTLSRNRQDN